MTKRAALGRLSLLAGALATMACSGPPGDEIFTPQVPSATDFAAVGDALATHCGTLDCHGNSARNMRVYGIDGIRLKPGFVSGDKGTTDEEYQATYSSVIAIQPEILSAIVKEHGAHPERWIVITKGRGTEHHKGGSPMHRGDPTDRCILSWIAGAVDPNACGPASIVEPPGGPGF